MGVVSNICPSCCLSLHTLNIVFSTINCCKKETNCSIKILPECRSLKHSREDPAFFVYYKYNTYNGAHAPSFHFANRFKYAVKRWSCIMRTQQTVDHWAILRSVPAALPLLTPKCFAGRRTSLSVTVLFSGFQNIFFRDDKHGCGCDKQHFMKRCAPAKWRQPL